MTDLRYERTHPNAFEWTDKAFDMLLDGRLDGQVHRRDGLEAATVAGACPRCGHQLLFETSPVAVGTGRRTLGQPGAELDPDEFVPIDVRCTCRADHPGRRESETGCGIAFRIEVRPETHDV
jgi:hypothetical protein